MAPRRRRHAGRGRDHLRHRRRRPSRVSSTWPWRRSTPGRRPPRRGDPAGSGPPGFRPEHVLDDLAERISPRVVEAPVRLDPVRRELDEYFEGRRQAFDLVIDWSLTGGFRRNVLEATRASRADTSSLTARLRRRSASRARPARSATRWGPTRSRSSFPATVWCPPRRGWATTAAARSARPSCSSSSTPKRVRRDAGSLRGRVDQIGARVGAREASHARCRRELSVPEHRRRRRCAPRRGVRAVRHRSRAVHRSPRSAASRSCRGTRRGCDRGASAIPPRTAGMSRPATGSRSRCSCRVAPATRASPASTGDASSRPRRHVRLHPRRQAARTVGRLRGDPVPRARHHRARVPTCSIPLSRRCSTRSGPASAGV